MVRPRFASQRGQAAPLCAISATGAVSAAATSGLKSVLANTGFGLKSGLVARGTPGLLKSVIGRMHASRMVCVASCPKRGLREEMRGGCSRLLDGGVIFVQSSNDAHDSQAVQVLISRHGDAGARPSAIHDGGAQFQDKANKLGLSPVIVWEGPMAKQRWPTAGQISINCELNVREHYRQGT